MGYTRGKEYHKIMANITIVKLKVRRGTDGQRKEIVLDQGEVGYTLDSKRLFVGDGATYGGKVAGNVNVGPFNSSASLGPAVDESPFLQVGDIGYADSRLFILTGASSTGRDYTNALSGWAYIGNVPDEEFIGFDPSNKLTIKKQSLDSQYLGSTFFGDGLLSSNTIAGQSNVALNADYFILSSYPGTDKRITPKQNSITKREIQALFPTASGLKGGNGEELALSVNERQFRFNDNKELELKHLYSVNVPISSWAGPGDGTSTTDGFLGGGLTVNTSTHRLQTTLQSVDETLLKADDGKITLNGATSGYQEMPFLDTNSGLITEIKSSIYDVITATGLSGSGAGDGVPIGSILPHAQAFEQPPAGYLLCNGHVLNATARPEYRDLYNKIGTVYGGSGRSSFNVPNLTGGDVLLYGTNGAINVDTRTLFLSATRSHLPGPKPNSSRAATISAAGVNFIIKYAEDPVLNIFNGAPNQVENNFGGKYGQQICYGVNSGGNETTLSSAGFITMTLSGTVRNPSSTDNNHFDRFAIPVYSY
jgi:microcystin-dependent protein